MAESAPQSLGEIARLQGRLNPQRTAFVFEGRSTTFADFDVRVDRVANGLSAAGVTKGSRVAYLGKNSDHYFELFFGAARIGAVIAPVNWRLAPPEAVFVLNDCRAEALFVGADCLALARSVVRDTPSLRLVVAMDGSDGDWPGYEAWRDANPATDPGVEVGLDDVAIQLYTSGTTGRPKGVMVRNSGLFGPPRPPGVEAPGWNSWGADEVILISMPNFHIGGTGWGFGTMLNGAKGVVTREFDPNHVLELIQRERITKIFLVPAAMQAVVRHPRAREIDYSSLRYVLYGAAPIPLELLRECMDVLKCGFVQMYGMTESTGAICVLPPEDHDPQGNERMRSAGKALAGVELEIADEDGRRLPPREVGEILIRSSKNMAGYWNQPEATKKTIDADGWLHTGDAGFLDEDGYLYIRDRLHDMIISGGENIYSAEVENAIFGHPAVADVAVIGVPDPKWGEAVRAIVVAKPGAERDPESILAWARERIASYKVPKAVDFIDELPRNPSGKILHRQLREHYWKGKERRVN